MKTLYAACLGRLGLSTSDAAELHSVAVDTIKSWASGRRSVPAHVWTALRQREAAIVDRSEAIREAWEDSGESRDVDAKCADELALLGLADFVLSNDARPALNVRMGDGSDRPSSGLAAAD